MPICTHCQQSLPATTEFFHPSKYGRYRLQAQCKACIAIKRKARRQRNLHKEKAYYRIYYDTHKEQVHEYHKKHRQRLRLTVLLQYSNGNLQCACCGESHLEFLTIDHMNGDGASHKKQIGRGQIYYYLIKNAFPSGYQVLCFNCNCAKGQNGVCPHQKERLRP